MTPKELIDALYRLKNDVSNKRLEEIVIEAFEQVRYDEFRACAELADSLEAPEIASSIRTVRLYELKKANNSAI